MIHELFFDSIKHPQGKEFHLASGFISTTNITFQNENIIVNIEAKSGETKFYDLNSNLLLSTVISTPVSGDKKFSDIKCLVENEQIKLGFPIYDYVDNYPNCDGEYDRWTKIISGYEYTCYDYKNNLIIE